MGLDPCSGPASEPGGSQHNPDHIKDPHKLLHTVCNRM